MPFLSCQIADQKKIDKKQLLFNRVLYFIKDNQIDSVKNYVYFDDTNSLSSSIHDVKSLLTEVQPNIDSVKLFDSVETGNQRYYGYKLNVYKDTLIGNIYMKFFNDTIIGMLSSEDYRPLHIDTSAFK